MVFFFFFLSLFSLSDIADANEENSFVSLVAQARRSRRELMSKGEEEGPTNGRDGLFLPAPVPVFAGQMEGKWGGLLQDLWWRQTSYLPGDDTISPDR